MFEPRLQQRLALVVREGLRGNHLLFATRDLTDALEARDEADGQVSVDQAVAAELGHVGIALSRAATLAEARALIDDLSPACRAALARLYMRFLGRCAAAQGHAQ